MSEITIHTGFMGDQNLIHVSWYDHNNVRYVTHLRVNIQPEDKPRTLVISVDDNVVFMKNDQGVSCRPIPWRNQVTNRLDHEEKKA